MKRIFIISIVLAAFMLCAGCESAEHKAYMEARNSRSIDRLELFLSQYPDGEHAEDARENIEQLRDDQTYRNAFESGSVDALESYLYMFPNGFHRSEAVRAIDSIKATPQYIAQKEMEQWLDNSLSTGSTPYRAYYGGNASCDSWGCSAINVTAPHGSDLVVTIKKGNKTGYVVRHAYINAGRTYHFEVPNGTYQVFFYQGNGWNPQKEMSGGIKGGFVSNESYSKTGVQYLEDQEWSLILQATINGNFNTQHSNEEEMF